MLELKKIKKDYKAGDSIVQALKGVDIQFRENEFVSILGPSGCGKTTLLNIIGGLDRYTSGDLVINNVSTKKYKDSDWDTYRNHSIGFVFQNYNLIPHQTVLSNVELALTLSGISKTERRKRAKEVLEKVGLGDQINKKPNQMSGGQMQRVAIARALINNPDILLADEPTGALDSGTSKQVMEILKEISKDKLIIMVTHNSEIAERYSSRIIKLLDGEVIDDTNPYNVTETERENTKKKDKKSGKTSMSFFTALSLSLNNLLTKKGRTILTAFAGSIGIIGIAAILSLSTGVRNYISKVEEDTLSSYPISIEETTVDMGSMLGTLIEVSEEEESKERDENKIYSKGIMTDMISMLSAQIEKNNLEEFKKYLEKDSNGITEHTNAIQYGYHLDLNLYKKDNETDKYIKVNPSQVMNSMGYGDMMQMQSSAFSMSSSFSNTDVWEELLDNDELVKSQYDLLAGKWPENFNEVVLIVDEDNTISDYTLYSLGLKDQQELETKMKALERGEVVEKDEEKEYSYDELLNLSFKVLLNTDYYKKENKFWVDKSSDEEYLKDKLENSADISVVGIIRMNEESIASSMAGMIGYTKELKEYVIERINEQEIVKDQKENENINIFTGLEFNNTNTAGTFDYSNLSNEQKSYMASLSDAELANLMSTYSTNLTATYESNLKTLGVVDLDSPSKISIYPKNFEGKESISQAITDYNQKQTDEGKDENIIRYTDLVGLMMNSVTSIIDVISSVLIAFVAISLIVSSIMIGIITYISVLERTKEIGILRSIGASKKDISRVFNAETFIVGLFAGLLGIGVTILIIIPANMVIKAVVGVSGLAFLPIEGAVILVLISMFLTIIAGLIPAKMASKKDPVVALRTE